MPNVPVVCWLLVLGLAWSQSIKPGCLPVLEGSTDLWCPGDNGYQCYKIPTLLRVPKNDGEVLIAFIEARKYSCADDGGHVDLLSRRSLDGGLTWGPPNLVWGNSTDDPKDWHTIGDALALYSPTEQLTHLVFTRDNRDIFYMRSSDAGLNWLTPRNISKGVLSRPGEFCGTGHTGGLEVQDSSASANFRLLVPMYGCSVGGPFVLSSEDGGVVWGAAGTISAPPNEWTFAATPIGSNADLLASVRTGSKRLQSRSTDGGRTWSEPRPVPELPEPLTGCEGALVSHPNGKLYFSHPDDPPLRNRMVVKVSADGGETWEDHREIWGPSSGCDQAAGCVPAASYSSMVVLGTEKDSEIGLMYMRNNRTMLVFEGTPSYTTFAP
jgi:sialidase-1